MEVRAMEYRPVMPTGVIPTGLQDYHTTIPDLSPPRSQGSSTGGASSIGDYAPRMYTPPTPPTPHDDDKWASTTSTEQPNHLTLIKSVKILPFTKKRFREIHR
ncbi:uncharacterized protein LOC143303473 isoform X1 [Bombus vancouverensis nearcticus]|uniref:uncharacterized protein LOC143303473 isoform X1 n=1 Tax=Bombus vancouverensis nearcticus TaxID=2705178 RepID=UPI00402B5FB8